LTSSPIKQAHCFDLGSKPSTSSGDAPGYTAERANEQHIIQITSMLGIWPFGVTICLLKLGRLPCQRPTASLQGPTPDTSRASPSLYEVLPANTQKPCFHRCGQICSANFRFSLTNKLTTTSEPNSRAPPSTHSVR
jgi:hypothetical protein